MSSDRQREILDRILDPLTQQLTPDAAKSLLDLRADPIAQARIDELADKCSEGLLTSDERAEYEAYVAAANVVTILQSKARRLLAGNTAA